MDKYILKIKFLGKDWKDYVFITNEFEKNETLHKDLKPADSSVKLQLLPDIKLNNLLIGIGEHDTPAQILKNGKPYFYGFIKQAFTIPKRQRLSPVTIELVSGGYFIKKKIGRDVFVNQKKTVRETVIEILNLAGVEYTDIPVINDVLYGVHLKPEDTYHKIISDILFEYGYTFYFNEEGKFTCAPLFIKKPVKEYELSGRDCIEVIELSQTESKKTQISVNWDGVEIVQDSYAFQETEGKQMGYSCYFEMRPATYYKNAPEGVYINYLHRDGPVIFAENVTVELDADVDIKVQKFEPLNTKAFIKMKNTETLFSRWVRKLNFKADRVYIKKTKNKSKAARNTTNEKAQSITAKYIYTKARAERLSKDLLNYYTISVLNYKIKSKKDIPLGAVVEVSDYGIGKGLARVVSKKTAVSEGVIEYLLEMAGAYEPYDTSNEAEVLPKPIQDGVNGKDGKPGKNGKDGKSLSFPKDKKAFFYFKFDDKKQTVPKPDKSYSAWQNRIIEFDCSQGVQVDVNFKQALNNIIILTGELKNDFVLNLYFDKENGNGAKQYVIVYKLTGSFSVTVKTPIQNVSKIIQNINDKTYGLCAYVVVDFKGNVWQFKGETGGTGPGFAVREIAAAINERDYFLIEQEKRIKKVEKEAAFFAIQKNDSPIGEVKTFYENDYKHGFLEANGLPFSPQVFPEFKDYCKRIFNTGTDAITGWPLRPKIERTDGTKVFLKAVQGV